MGRGTEIAVQPRRETNGRSNAMIFNPSANHGMRTDALPFSSSWAGMVKPRLEFA